MKANNASISSNVLFDRLFAETHQIQCELRRVRRRLNHLSGVMTSQTATLLDVAYAQSEVLEELTKGLANDQPASANVGAVEEYTSFRPKEG